MRVIFQLDEMDCGPACIAMIASFLGKNYSVQHIREQSYLTREGVSIQGIKEACSAIGLDSRSYFLSYEELILLEDNYFPCILHWNQNHFVVLNRNIHSRRFLFFKRKKFGIADPAHGYVKLSEEAFKESWVTQNGKGIAIFMQKTPDFVQREPIKSVEIGISYFFKYLQPYKKLIFVFLIVHR